MSDRRIFLVFLSTVIFWGQPAAAQAMPETILLWPGAPPEGPGPQGPPRVKGKGSVTNVALPYLIVHRPARANGAAILLISGGGYAHIELGKESGPAAAWLATLGVTTFELVYRLPGEGWGSSAVPFQDGQRAMRLIAARAAEFGIDRAKIGVLGFSAGGHLAGMLAAQPGHRWYSPVDDADRSGGRPAFAALIYPVLTMMAPFDTTHAKKSIIGPHPAPDQRAAYSVERLVTSQMPATFLVQALDDPVAPVDNSLLMLAALRSAGVPAELHLFQAGGHGWGLGAEGSQVHAWTGLFVAWCRKNGVFE